MPNEDMSQRTLLHNLERHEALRKELQTQIDKKVPIWVFNLSVLILVTVIGGLSYMNYSMQKNISELEKEHAVFQNTLERRQ